MFKDIKLYSNKYILCEFVSGYTGQFYELRTYDNNLINYLNLDGSVLNIPQIDEPNYIEYQYNIINENPIVEFLNKS